MDNSPYIDDSNENGLATGQVENKGNSMMFRERRSTRLANFLGARPSFDAVAQFLVFETFASAKPRAAVITSLTTDGNISVPGSFGLPQDAVQALRNLNPWDHAPSVDVVREGGVVNLPNQDAVVDTYPWVQRFPSLAVPTIAWPLETATGRLGSLQLFFVDESPKELAEQPHQDVLPILGLYVAVLTRPQTFSTVPETESADVTMKAEPKAGTKLTARQHTILQLMSRGLTNAQIAQRIGYSESTVRQETMAIYRHFGADGRQEAVYLAGLRGLLAEEDVSPAELVAANGHSSHWTS